MLHLARLCPSWNLRHTATNRCNCSRSRSSLRIKQLWTTAAFILQHVNSLVFWVLTRTRRPTSHPLHGALDRRAEVRAAYPTLNYLACGLSIRRAWLRLDSSLTPPLGGASYPPWRLALLARCPICAVIDTKNIQHSDVPFFSPYEDKPDAFDLPFTTNELIPLMITR